MGLIRKLAGMALGFVGFIAGFLSCDAPAYGMQPAYGIPTPPHDSSVTLDDFSYTPPSPASPGDTLEFSATTNKPTDAAWIGIEIGDPRLFGTYLTDDGFGADDIAHDGIWHGEIELPLEATAADDIPIVARLNWLDGAKGQELAGEELTILEDGE